MHRKFPRPIKRIVVKLGSSVIATNAMKPRMVHLRSLIDQICVLQRKGIEVAVVSSGAIVLGMGELGKKKRPQDLASLQALAAIGQTVLMKKYDDLFKRNKSRCAQLLLTWEDFTDRKRYNNARNTVQAIFDAKVIPVINENDTISTDEIKFGDNDKLSALVASMLQADLLILLSDVEGLYDLSGPQKKLLNEIQEITGAIHGLAGGSANKNISKGGMAAKLEAIKIASHANVPCVIANGQTEDVLSRIMQKERIGTFFSEKKEKLLSRKHWISFGAKPKGVLIIDDGAVTALNKGGRSLLLPGVVRWEGHFKENDVVVVQDRHHHEIGRGIINYSSSAMQGVEDKRKKTEVIHCDNLVISRR